jgi:hypothetical protein
VDLVPGPSNYISVATGIFRRHWIAAVVFLRPSLPMGNIYELLFRVTA